MRVELFVSCLVDQMWPRAGRAAVEVLRRAGCEVAFDPRQTCCGQPAFNAGLKADARRVARQFVRVFGTSDADAIVVPSGSCAAMIRRHLASLLTDPAERGRAEAIAARTHELASFLVRELGIVSVGGRLDARVVYHDSCHALRELDVHDEPRELLAGTGAEVVEFESGATCCGFGGAFAVKHEALSVAMLDRRLEGLADLGVDAVVSTDVSCLMQIEGRLQRRAAPVKSFHLAELLVADGGLPE